MNQTLVDTTVLIEYLRQDSVARSFIKNNLPYFSTVAKAELIQGARDKKELAIIIGFLKDLEELTINERVASLAIELTEKHYLSHHLLFLDALVAATALEENLTLVTENVKHFSFIPGLKIQDWKEIEKSEH